MLVQANEIETTVSGDTITIGLPNDVTVGNNLTVGSLRQTILQQQQQLINGNLTVTGTTINNQLQLTLQIQFLKLVMIQVMIT